MSRFAGRRARIVAIGLGLSSLPAFAGVAPYDFTIKSSQSGLDASINFGVSTAGTLIGNYDPDGNPAGTRTKPGLFGPFGDTENVPVDMSLGVAIVGQPDTQTAGGFQIAADIDAGLLNLSSFTADLLHSGPESLTAELTLMTETFRTRNPTFLYIGGIPITLPIGQATLTALTATQVGDFAPGTLTPIGPDRYSFAVAPVLTLAGTIELLGTEMALPETPALFPLTGEIEFAGDTAHLSSIQALDLQNSFDPMLSLPQFAFDLPTLDPDSPAHVLMDLMLNEISASLAGELRIEANGVLVPEPTTLGLFLVLPLIAGRSALRPGPFRR
jgi:hypothetical protein